MSFRVIDGDFPPIPGRGGGSFVNDPLDQRVNSKFIRIDTTTGVQRHGSKTLTRVFVKSIVPIKDGEEIFASYGNVYWGFHAPGRLVDIWMISNLLVVRNFFRPGFIANS